MTRCDYSTRILDGSEDCVVYCANEKGHVGGHLIVVPSK